MSKRPPAERPSKPPRERKTTQVQSLTPGSLFRLKGEEFKLERLTDTSAHVILMERSTIRTGPFRTKEISYGVARLEIPRDTTID